MPRRTARAIRRALLSSPMRPAVVIVLVVAVAAGLFAGSYTYAMANPTPRDVPTAVVGAAASPAGRARFVTGMEKELGASLRLHRFATYDDARAAVGQQRIFAILHQRSGRPQLDVAAASGASVAQLLTEAAARVGRATGEPVAVRDVEPLQPGDPRGLAIFYISLASVVLGFVGAAQLTVHAKELSPGQRIAFTAAYALLGAFTIAAVTDWGLHAVRLAFAESWLILAATMFTSGMVFSMFHVLVGRWALVPTWGLMVVLGNPWSGGAVSWPLLPAPLGTIGRWLPPGAAVNAQHTAVYFGAAQHAFPFLVLAGWAAVATAVFWVRRHDGPLVGLPPRDPEPAAAAGG